MFQRAQEASDEGRYEQALAYYEEFIRRYPDDPGAIVEAEYEIAFLAYKQDQLSDAREGFQEILSKYESAGTNALPAWPRVLSEKLLDRIDQQIEDEGLLDGNVGDTQAGDTQTGADTTSSE